MIRTVLFIFVYISGHLLSGCAKMQLNETEYRAWITESDNGLTDENEQEFLNVSIKYMPDDYVALLDCKDSRNRNACMQERKKEIAGLQYFQFRMALNNSVSSEETDLLKYGISSPADYSYRVQYCMAHLQQDLELEEKGKRYPCKLLHFERTYGMAPYLSFLAVFERNTDNKKINDKTFYYTDHLFNLGTIKLKLSGSDLSAVPQLKP